MKKLFTVLVLLTFFIGVKADEIIDAEVDFSKLADGSEIKFYGFGASESARARLSIANGCLHFHSEEATDPSWDCQFHPIGGVDAEVGVVYTLHFKVKGSVAQNVSMLGFGQTPYGQFSITTDWVEGTFDYECTEANGNILMQCGDYVGDWDIAYLKITHEGISELCYNYIKKGNVAEVISEPNGRKYSGNIEIPATVMHEGIEYDVKSIGSQAFKDCGGLTSVIIPNSVTSIGSYAFSGCSGLTTVTIPNSVTSIGQSAFQGCSKLTSVNIPDNVTSIGQNVFSGCTGLTSLPIHNSVTSIGDFAFSGCTGLNSVNIPNSVISIGEYAFMNCTSLTSVTIGNSVKNIGDHAFRECNSLTSVTIPNSVESLGFCAFYGCCSLPSVTIPNSVTSIGNSAFMNCSSLTSVTIPNSVSSIGGGTFSGCSSLNSVTIPNSVTFIVKGAFENCELLTDVYCLAEQVRENNSYGSQGLYTHPEAFVDSYQEFITLHVPAASIEAYKAIEPWKSFKEVVALDGGEIPVTPKCATPTISLVNGKITFSCETEGVEYISEVTVSDAKKYYDNEISAPKKFKVTVYATKASYDNSDTATAEFDFSSDTSLSGDVDGNGIVNVADHVKLSDIIMHQE